VLRVFHYAQTHPILSIGPTAQKTGSTFPTVAAAIDHMQRQAGSATGCSLIAVTWTS
jgi:hypothetical protein